MRCDKCGGFLIDDEDSPEKIRMEVGAKKALGIEIKRKRPKKCLNCGKRFHPNDHEKV